MSNCLAVPRDILERLPFWSRLEKVDGVLSAATGLAADDIDGLLNAIRQNAAFMERKGDDGLENRPEWQQIIFYALIIQNGKFFVYKRASTGSKYSETRLYDKLSAGVGGHIEPFDSDIVDSLGREIAEELTLYRGEQEVPLTSPMQILGVIKDDTSEVNRVHLGLACVIHLDDPQVRVSLRGSAENVACWMVSYADYPQLCQDHQLVPEDWTALMLERIVAPAGLLG